MIQPRDVVTRMLAIEDNVSGETGEDAPPLDRVVSVLLGVEYDGLDVVLAAEAKRVLELADEWYFKHGVRPTAANIAGLGIVQGITFAVAANRLRDGSSVPPPTADSMSGGTEREQHEADHQQDDPDGEEDRQLGHEQADDEQDEAEDDHGDGLPEYGEAER